MKMVMEPVDNLNFRLNHFYYSLLKYFQPSGQVTLGMLMPCG